LLAIHASLNGVNRDPAAAHGGLAGARRPYANAWQAYVRLDEAMLTSR